MHVYVRMVVPVVPVLVDVHTLLRRLPDTPEPDRDEDQSDQPLAPFGQALHRKDLAQKESRDAYDHDPRGCGEGLGREMDTHDDRRSCVPESVPNRRLYSLE